MTDLAWTGRCNCGRVTLRARGKPKRVGICHCLTCRRQTGSAFLAFAIWPRDDVEVAGRTRSWREEKYDRHFCPECGSGIYDVGGRDDEIEVRLGILDEAPSGLTPIHECWIERREAWMTSVAGAKKFLHNANGD